MTAKVSHYFMAAVLAIALFAQTGVAAIADDWVATKLRGGVFAFNGEDWDRLARGSVVSDERIIRTVSGGRAQFTRGVETIDVGGDTQIRIFDRAGEEKYTTVQQHYGVVAIEAERRNVKHFSVQTPFLAAVVKGTRFEVRVDDSKAEVGVNRGRVEVRDTVHDLKVNVTAGQSAEAGEAEYLAVAGTGDLEPVTNFAGKVVDVAELAANENKGSGNNNAGGNSNGAGKSANSNAGGNGKANSGSGNNNAGGNSNGAGNSANSHAGGNGNGNSGSGNSNAGGNGNGNSGSGSNNAGGNSNGAGKSADSHAGGNGKGKGKG